MILWFPGKKTYLWLGPKPAMVIMDPEQVKEITQKVYVFQKPHGNPLRRMLTPGIVMYEGDKWTQHRKLLNPAFHIEKLKVLSNLIIYGFI